MAALLFRGGATGFLGSGESGKEKAAAQTSAQQIKGGEGPWIASCEYWAPARLPDGDVAVSPEPSIKISLDASNQKVYGTIDASKTDAEPTCEGAKTSWGLPTTYTPRITTIIATVPDPIHSTFSLQFDRIMDALIDAGEDNGYLSSYYWLPWEKATEKLKGAGENASERSLSKQEHEPGLIIFKHTFNSKDGDVNEGFATPLYLFLIGETPTSGIDGQQMQKALKYEKDLTDAGAQVVRSFKAKDQLAIIGPLFSGSAASFRDALDTEMASDCDHKIHLVQARGITSTRWAANHLNGIHQTSPCGPGAQAGGNTSDQKRLIEYSSFANDTVFDQSQLARLIGASGTAENRIAVLIEDGTTLGQASLLDLKEKKQPPLFIRFPREISMLRNAEMEQEARSGAMEHGNSPPSPYLHLSLEDSNAYDSVPHLSRQITPLSQEAQLMTIARQLLRYHAEYVVISATDVLDQLFLAQFLHRALPDARLVFDGGDLLFEREIDNVPFIGSLTVGPYPMPWLTNPLGAAYGGRAFSDWGTEAYYNAASYTFSDNTSTIKLADYHNPFNHIDSQIAPPLWVTAIGSDGYYPLGIASANASSNDTILPKIQLQNSDVSAGKSKMLSLPFHPSRAWHFLCLFVFALCVTHAMLMHLADFWSPFTRDLAIDQNDQPHRRSMCIHIGAAMLFSMSVVVAWPLVASLPVIQPDVLSWVAAIGTLLAGAGAVFATLGKTWHYRRMPRLQKCSDDTLFYNKFNLLALVTAVALPVLWCLICNADLFALPGSHAGLFFAYRCLHPDSGVSPSVPILLLLLSWYLWSIFQTLRLRFSDCNRPYLPSLVSSETSYPLYVADDNLNDCNNRHSSCLYRNITCLLITREAVQRFFQSRTSRKKEPPQTIPKTPEQIKKKIDRALMALYFLTFLLLTLMPLAQSMDRLLWSPRHLPTPYEFLIKALFFPLLIIALTGWLRMIFVWGALQRGLLQRLENLPIRFAFDRLKGAGWIAMFRQSGLREQWRDMARSTESMRQLFNDPDLPSGLGDTLRIPYDNLNKHITALLLHIGGKEQPNQAILAAAENLCSNSGDLPCSECRLDLGLTHALEKNYAQFAGALLEHLLLPYWSNKRTGVVESEESAPELCKSLKKCLEKPGDSKQSHTAHEAPATIRAAEEFVVIRYVSLIRAVLVNLRYLMAFISAAFVLAIVAWNSYPFEPHQLVNWLFTLLLLALGLGVIWVFAQMHRDPILSRITHTTPNELGLDFYIRIVSFGAVPVLAWLAYNFPDVGGTLFKIVRPGIEVMK